MDMAGPLTQLWGMKADRSSHSSAYLYQQFVTALPVSKKKNSNLHPSGRNQED